MRCSRCGSTLEPDSRFCKQCGATLQPYTRRIEVAGQAVSAPASQVAVKAPSDPSTPNTARVSGKSLTAVAAPALELPPRPVSPPAEARPDADDPAVERLIWEGRPAWRAFYPQWVLWTVACVFASYLIFTRTAAGGFLRNTLWLLVAASAVAILTRELLIIFGVRYRLTTQRLFVDHGILTLVTDQAELLRVHDVRIRRRLLDRLTGVGCVEVLSDDASEQTVTLESVERPGDIAEAVRRCAHGIRDGKTVYLEAL